MPGRIYVLATHIYQSIATGFAADFGKAAAIGMSVLATSITLIYIYRYLTSEGEKYVTISSRGYRPSVIQLKGARYPLFGVVGILSMVLIVLPVLAALAILIVVASLQAILQWTTSWQLGGRIFVVLGVTDRKSVV